MPIVTDDETVRKKELDELLANPYMLTTLDNPFSPFVQYQQWLAFDESRGYFTNNYLARIVRTSVELNEYDEAVAIQDAIDEIVRLDVLGIYAKVQEATFVDRSETVVFPTVTLTTE